MKRSEVAVRYAKALFEIAEESYKSRLRLNAARHTAFEYRADFRAAGNLSFHGRGG